jgi:quinol-cytochrome oxidoreductase complex cytochrome b subunit
LNITSTKKYFENNPSARLYTSLIGLSPIMCFWIIFIFYRYSQYLLFDILAVAVTLIVVSIIIFRSKNYIDEHNLRKSALHAFRLVAILLFVIFLVVSLYYGGTADTEKSVSELYENYEPGNYYISSHGDYTLVPYKLWYRLRILEVVTLPSFFIMFIWSVIDRAHDVGWSHVFKRDD